MISFCKCPFKNEYSTLEDYAKMKEIIQILQDSTYM